MAHIRYRASRTTQQENPWKHVLDGLKAKVKVAPAPRLLPEWQMYMREPDSADKIDTVFKERWPEANRPEVDKLAFRGEIARELLAGEKEDVWARLRRKCEEEHEKDLQTYDADETVDYKAPDEESKAQ